MLLFYKGIEVVGYFLTVKGLIKNVLILFISDIHFNCFSILIQKNHQIVEMKILKNEIWKPFTVVFIHAHFKICAKF